MTRSVSYRAFCVPCQWSFTVGVRELADRLRTIHNKSNCSTGSAVVVAGDRGAGDLDRSKWMTCQCDHETEYRYGRVIDGVWYCLVCTSRKLDGRLDEAAGLSAPDQEPTAVADGGRK